MNVYTDGSFIDGKARWGFVVFDGDKEIYRNKGIIDNIGWNTGRQIAGECQAVLEALKWAKENNQKIVIAYDYIGCLNWIIDYLYLDKIPWKQNKEYTKLYRQNFFLLKDWVKDMVWVKGHSGVRGNEIVDKYLKTDLHAKDCR